MVLPRCSDFHSGIAVNSLGHSHPAWSAALSAQSTQLAHVSNLFFSKPQTVLAKQLIEMSGGAFDKVFFCNSGTEATEAALKFVRKYQLVQQQKREAAASAEVAASNAAERTKRADQTRRPHDKLDLLAFAGGFHGRSVGALSLTSKWQYRSPFAPLLSDVRFLPYNDVAALESAVGPWTAGLFVEPIQGEVAPQAEEGRGKRAQARSLGNLHPLFLIRCAVCVVCLLGRRSSRLA